VPTDEEVTGEWRRLQTGISCFASSIVTFHVKKIKKNGLNGGGGGGAGVGKKIHE
jgi:hypothetical protein